MKIIVLFVFMIFVSIITVSSFVSFFPDLSADRLVYTKKIPFTFLFITIPPIITHFYICCHLVCPPRHLKYNNI